MQKLQGMVCYRSNGIWGPGWIQHDLHSLRALQAAFMLPKEQKHSIVVLAIVTMVVHAALHS